VQEQLSGPQRAERPRRIVLTVARSFVRLDGGLELLRQLVTRLYLWAPDAVLVHGDCPEGDRDAAVVWRRLGGRVEAHPADWTGPCVETCPPGHRRLRRGPGVRGGASSRGTSCPAAGMRRNLEMLDTLDPEVDEVRALLAPGSRGAAGTVAEAHRRGLRVREFDISHGAALV